MQRANKWWHSIRFRLVMIYLLLILFALQLVGAYFVRTLNASLLNGETTSVEKQAELLATIVAPDLAEGPKGQNPSDIPSLLSSFPQSLSGMFYILNKKGIVQDTSAGSALIGQKRIDSIATQALVGKKKAIGIRFDPGTGSHILAVAVPVMSHGNLVGVVEDVVPVENTYSTVQKVTTIFYTTSGTVLLLTVLLIIFLSRTITKPIVEVTRQARGMAAGDFSKRVGVDSDDELGDLGQAINELANSLEQALSENSRERDRLQAIITYMGDGVIALAADGTPMFANDTARRLLGYDSSDLNNAAKLLQLEGPMKEGVQQTSLICDIGQSLVHVNMTALKQNAKLSGYVAVIHDVTEQERLNNARRNFVADVSHELRTPLTSIKSYLEALREGQGTLDDKTQSSFLAVCEQETDRMARLTQDLLQLSGLESGNVRYEPVRLNVLQLVESVLNRLALQVKQQKLRIDVVIDSTLHVDGDPDMLHRLFDNVIGNALKFTPSGGRITITAEALNDEVDIHIKDTGIGIPKEDLSHVFDRFYRVEKARSRRKGGTGLGLALAREIVELHDGKINLDSTLNKGTTVTITLPLCEGEFR